MEKNNPFLCFRPNTFDSSKSQQNHAIALYEKIQNSADIVFIVQGQEVLAHRFFVLPRCQYLQNIFDNRLKSSKTNVENMASNLIFIHLTLGC